VINTNIVVSKIESEKRLRDLSTETGGEIVGGGTSGSASADVSAFGDVAQTKSDSRANASYFYNAYWKKVLAIIYFCC